MPKMTSDTLIEAARTALCQRRVNQPLELIASECGVSEAWLWAFINQKIPDPSARRVERVYTYVTGRKIRF